MFTPPSPLPSPGGENVQESPRKTTMLVESKCSTGRRAKWAVLFVPLALVLITASTRYITHPVAFDIFTESLPLDWHTLSTKGTDWRRHKRHPQDAEQTVVETSIISGSTATLIFSPTAAASATSATSTAVTTTTPASGQALPTIPTDPELPTPFPQSFDSDVSQNFSSMTCYQFFTNMTNTAAFRSCRPFSVLLQTSSSFIKMQDNLTELNTVIWGTCNPTVGYSQCVMNMAWFASTLKTQCEADIADNNSNAIDTLASLQAYSTMYTAACLTDPTTDTYCYVNAVHNSDPSDLYFYELPLGISVPNSSTPSCSACTKSLMTVYADGLDNSSTSGLLDDLRKSYPAAQELATGNCGSDYARTVAAVASGALILRAGAVVVLVISALTAWTLYTLV
ncbi:hypothetical protein DFS33DRAFT_1383701 [Desarmillaria ectypa]|nr:hypothetical protein DFS33DRAFT_1383701 [Desarmillaria ectypa]